MCILYIVNIYIHFHNISIIASNIIFFVNIRKFSEVCPLREVARPARVASGRWVAFFLVFQPTPQKNPNLVFFSSNPMLQS